MKTDRDVIIRFAFNNSENLRIALLVGSAYDDIRHRLVQERFEKVGSRLKEALGADWTFRLSGEEDAPELFLYFRKSVWSKNMELGFGADSPDGDVYFFATRAHAQEQSAIDEQLRGSLDIRSALAESQPRPAAGTAFLINTATGAKSIYWRNWR